MCQHLVTWYVRRPYIIAFRLPTALSLSLTISVLLMHQCAVELYT